MSRTYLLATEFNCPDNPSKCLYNFLQTDESSHSLVVDWSEANFFGDTTCLNIEITLFGGMTEEEFAEDLKQEIKLIFGAVQGYINLTCLEYLPFTQYPLGEANEG